MSYLDLQISDRALYHGERVVITGFDGRQKHTAYIRERWRKETFPVESSKLTRIIKTKK